MYTKRYSLENAHTKWKEQNGIKIKQKTKTKKKQKKKKEKKVHEMTRPEVCEESGDSKH